MTVTARKVSASPEAILLELQEQRGMLLEILALLDELRPLLPHVPAALKMLDNPAVRFRRRRDG